MVVFHYIVGSGYPGLELKGPTTGEFLHLLDSLKTQFKMVDLSTLAKKKNVNVGEDVCGITFDDGLIDHYNIAKELIRRDIPATFFPVASVFDGYVPPPIKMHVILSKIKTEQVVKGLEKFLLRQNMEFLVPLPRDKKMSDLRPLDDVLTANLKHVMQNLPKEMKNAFISEQFSMIVSDEKKFCRDFFMTPEQLREMHENGIGIGSHTYSHTSLETLNYAEQKEDVARSKKIIEDIIGSEIKSISYPYGGYNQYTTSAMRDLGFKYGVVFVHRQISSTDDDLLLPNLDCRDHMPFSTLA